MTALTARILNGSTDGKPICIARTATLGTTIHVAVAGTDTTLDKISAYLVNNDSIAHLATVEIGGAAQANIFIVNVPPNLGPFQFLDRHPLRNSAVITVFADLSSVLAVIGDCLSGVP